MRAINGLPGRMASRLAFMSREHHAIRDFVVREMPRQNRPLSPLGIAQTTGFEIRDVASILGDLEKHLFFLVRDEDGDVSFESDVRWSTFQGANIIHDF